MSRVYAEKNTEERVASRLRREQQEQRGVSALPDQDSNRFEGISGGEGDRRSTVDENYEVTVETVGRTRELEGKLTPRPQKSLSQEAAVSSGTEPEATPRERRGPRLGRASDAITI